MPETIQMHGSLTPYGKNMTWIFASRVSGGLGDVNRKCNVVRYVRNHTLCTTTVHHFICVWILRGKFALYIVSSKTSHFIDARMASIRISIYCSPLSKLPSDYFGSRERLNEGVILDTAMQSVSRYTLDTMFQDDALFISMKVGHQVHTHRARLHRVLLWLTSYWLPTYMGGMRTQIQLFKTL